MTSARFCFTSAAISFCTLAFCPRHRRFESARYYPFHILLFSSKLPLFHSAPFSKSPSFSIKTTHFPLHRLAEFGTKAFSCSTASAVRKMAVTARGRAELSRHWKEREASPERTMVWVEPRPKKVSVVYYLSRNGQLEHPHFMEVTLSSRDGLYLRDVIHRLNLLRGNGMANMYSWSSKRSYKNGFVWHDLSEDDFIHPAHGQEYVLKGSEILRRSSSGSSSSSERIALEIPRSVPETLDFPPARRKKTPWSSLDLGEYKVYKTDVNVADISTKAMDAATQTDDKRRQRQPEDEDRGRVPQEEESLTAELCGDEISPPPSSSSTETLESLIKSDGRIVAVSAVDDQERAADSCPSGRLRASASAVLMQLISCGSFSAKDSAAAEYRRRLPRYGVAEHQEEAREIAGGSFSAGKFEEREYFSGSLVETKNQSHGGDVAAASSSAALRRSSSYNADRTSKMGMEETEMDGVTAKCMPRKPKAAGKAGDGNSTVSRSAYRSKRMIEDEQN